MIHEKKKPLFSYRSFKRGYGHFPYIIMKPASSFYMQIPIHLLRETEGIDITRHPGTQIFGFTAKQLKWKRGILIEYAHDLLVESPEKAYFIEKESITFSTKIPTGGTLLTQGNEILAINERHYLEKELQL
jgi:hypothetical protein